jgi:glycerophosphoryl diester phosphodiesterase
MDARLRPPIGFAHRGARAHAPENTIEAFVLAKRLGATGLESDVWITSDGHPVLDHDGVVKVGLRKKMIRDVVRAELPKDIPGLDDLYAAVGVSLPLSLDIKDPLALAPTVAVARAAGGSAAENLWICDHSWERLAEQRAQFADVRFVDSTRLKRLKTGPERHAAQLSAAGIDAINMHHTDWNLGLTTLFHRFNLFTFGWDAQFERVIHELLTYEIDALYCDNTELMMTTLNRAFLGPSA